MIAELHKLCPKATIFSLRPTRALFDYLAVWIFQHDARIERSAIGFQHDK